MKKIIYLLFLGIVLSKNIAFSQYLGHFSSKDFLFKETFENNSNNWDLYSSELSSAELINESMVLQSFQDRGTSRFVFLQQNFHEFSIEVKLNPQKNTIKKNRINSSGLIFGFKDWDNYWYFNIFDSNFEIGQVLEGIISRKVDLEYSAHIALNTENLLKVIVADNKMVFSINGEIHSRLKRPVIDGNGIGVAIGGNGSKCIFDDLILKGFGEKNYRNDVNPSVKSSGSGLVISEGGIIATNYHVIDGAQKIVVSTQMGDFKKDFLAKVLMSDKENDLALIQIDDTSFVNFPNIPYSFRTTGGFDLGSSIFTIGFPLALSGMGTDPKFSDGKISSKSGYEGSSNGFQTSIPVQPGNSGGPVFNSQGELIGIINSKIFDADNVSYGIKALFLVALIESVTPALVLPSNNTIADLRLEEQIKILTDFVVLIKIS